MPEKPSESIEQYTPKAPVVQVSFPPYQPAEQWVTVEQFGGMNLFFPPDKLPPNQAQDITNFLPYGAYWLKKREGYGKVYYTDRGPVYGLALGDSSNSKSRLVIVADNDLYFTDQSHSWLLQDFGNTTAELTFFTSTPFGLVISNDGSDSARLWDGISVSTIKPLGICITGTMDYDTVNPGGTDTVRIVDSTQAWTNDEWIGYFVYLTSVDSLWKIVDNGDMWVDAVSSHPGDTNRHDESYEIIAQPDSASSDLIYPRGKAAAYYQDRLFVASAFYPWRIWYSDQRLINQIAPESFINLDMDAHDKIQAMRNFNNHLIILGEHSLYGVDNNLTAYPISKTIGCASPKTVAVGDDFIYFLSHRGVYRFAGNIYGSFSYKLEKISDPVNGILDKIEANDLGNCGAYYGDKQYWLSYHPDSCLVFDERTSGWYRQTFGFTDALDFAGSFGVSWNEKLRPNADDGDTIYWRCSSGTDHYALVDDETDDTDYIWTPFNDSLDFLDMSNTALCPTGAVISHVTFYVRAQKYTYCKSDLKLELVGNGQRYNLGTFYLSGPWETQSIEKATNPITSLAWTKDDLDSMELALIPDLNESCTYRRVFVSGLWVECHYSGNLTTRDFLFGSPNSPYVYQYGGIATDDTSSDSTYNVTGVAITSTYQSGWFHTDLPINQYQMEKLWIDKLADGDVTTYLYTNRSSTATDTITYSSTSDAAELEWLEPQIAGHDFSIKIETSADSCFLKGWGALLRNLGERKD